MAAEKTQAIAATARLKTFGTITAVGLLGAVIVSAFTHDFGFDGKTLFGDGGNAPYAGAKDGLSKNATDGVNPPHEVNVREALKRQAYENATRGGPGSGASNDDALPAEWVAVVNGHREKQANTQHPVKPASAPKQAEPKQKQAEQRAHDVSVKVVPKEEAILQGLGWGEVKAKPSLEGQEKPLAQRIKENETKTAYGHKEEGNGKDLEAKLKSMGRVKFCATYGKNEAAWYCNGDTQKIARYDYAPTVAVK